MFCISDELFFALPAFAYAIFFILSFIKSPPQSKKIFRKIKYDRRAIRRFYYLFNLSWFISFAVRYYNDIKEMSFIFQGTNFGGIINVILLLIIFLIISLIWDMIFISCRSISSLTFKGVSITTEDIEKIKSTSIITKEIIESLYTVLKAQDFIFMHMNDIISSINKMNIDNFFYAYNQLIRVYAGKRKNIRFRCFEYNEKGIEQFKEKYKLDETSASSILFTLKTCGVCIPHDDGLDYDIIYSVLETMHFKDNIILVLEGNNLIIDEHLIIQHIVVLFDYQIIVYNLKDAYIKYKDNLMGGEGSDQD